MEKNRSIQLNTDLLIKIFKSYYLVVFVVIYAFMFLKSAMIPDLLNGFIIVISDDLQKSLILVSFVYLFVLAALKFKDRKINKSFVILLLFRLTLLILSFVNTFIIEFSFAPHFVWIMLILVITADANSEESYLKTAYYIGISIVVLLFFLSLTGIIPNNDGNSFGFVYRTDYACFLFSLLLTKLIYKDGKLLWWEEMLMLALLPVFYLIKCKTAIILTFLTIIATLWRHYRKSGGVPYQDRKQYGFLIPVLFSVIYFPIRIADHIAGTLKPNTLKGVLKRILPFSFIGCAGLSLFFTLTYKKLYLLWDKIPGVGTLKDRWGLGLIGFEEFGLTLMGSKIELLGNGRIDGGERSFYFWLDSSYIQVLLIYGIIVFIAFIILLTIANFRLYKNKRYYTLILLSIFAVDCIVEHHLSELCNDVFILLAFCKLSPKNENDSHNVQERKFKTPKQRIILSLMAVFIALFFGVWFYSAYRITNWRGTPPDFGATLVIPGDYIDMTSSPDLTEIRFKNAYAYLSIHPKSCCIVSNDDIKNRLSKLGIEQGRVLVDSNSTNIDEMLKNSDELISTNNLPNRLTVCTFTIQQDRVARHADNLLIPVDGLSFDMPLNKHFITFTYEQMRFLCKD